MCNASFISSGSYVSGVEPLHWHDLVSRITSINHKQTNNMIEMFTINRKQFLNRASGCLFISTPTSQYCSQPCGKYSYFLKQDSFLNVTVNVQFHLNVTFSGMDISSSFTGCYGSHALLQWHYLPSQIFTSKPQCGKRREYSLLIPQANVLLLYNHRGNQKINKFVFSYHINNKQNKKLYYGTLLVAAEFSDSSSVVVPIPES